MKPRRGERRLDWLLVATATAILVAFAAIARIPQISFRWGPALILTAAIVLLLLILRAQSLAHHALSLIKCTLVVMPAPCADDHNVVILRSVLCDEGSQRKLHRPCPIRVPPRTQTSSPATNDHHSQSRRSRRRPKRHRYPHSCPAFSRARLKSGNSFRQRAARRTSCFRHGCVPAMGLANALRRQTRRGSCGVAPPHRIRAPGRGNSSLHRAQMHSQQAFILVDPSGERTVLWKRDPRLTFSPKNFSANGS